MSEWQPIETAPNDGTEIDLWVEDFRVGESGRLTSEPVGRVPKAWWGTTLHVYGGENGVVHGKRDEWVYTDQYFPCGADQVEVGGRRATHWMRIPGRPDQLR